MAKTSNKTMGIFCILLSGLCFTGMNTFVRLSGDLPTMQKVFFPVSYTHLRAHET